MSTIDPSILFHNFSWDYWARFARLLAHFFEKRGRIERKVSFYLTQPLAIIAKIAENINVIWLDIGIKRSRNLIKIDQNSSMYLAKAARGRPPTERSVFNFFSIFSNLDWILLNSFEMEKVINFMSQASGENFRRLKIDEDVWHNFYSFCSNSSTQKFCKAFTSMMTMVMDKFRKEYFATVSMVLIAIDSSALDLPFFCWIASHKPFEATIYF